MNRWKLTLLSGILLLGFEPASAQPAAQQELVSDKMLMKVYKKAVEDAQNITPSKLSSRLWSVDDAWVDRKHDSLVLALAVIKAADLDKWTGSAQKQTPSSWDDAVWISLSPELSMILHDSPVYDSLQVNLRMKTILGLPPLEEYTHIVQFWVPVSRLVRPTPDPDVHNHFSTVKFPENVSPEHKQWIEHLRNTVYTSDPAYPWTSLGYTYDWANPYNDFIGISEFVVKPNTPIRIAQLSTLWYWYNQQVDIPKDTAPSSAPAPNASTPPTVQ